MIEVAEKYGHSPAQISVAWLLSKPEVTAPIVGGGGGGRPEFAQAGGRDASKIPDALEKAAEIMALALS